MIMMVIGAATQSSTITYILPIYAGITIGPIFVVLIIVFCRKKWQERVRPIFNDGSRFKQIMFMGGVITSVVGIIMIIVGGVSKNQTIVDIGAYLLVAILFSFFIRGFYKQCGGTRC
jgi:membrane protein implicated in regulation of membrane protease activity